MKSDRATARVVGGLFIVGTVAGGLGLALSQPLVDASDYLTKLSLHEDRVATGALLTLIMGVALVGMSIVIYPVLRRHSERLALGYVVARTVESVIYVIDAVLLLTLLTVSRGFVDAGAPDASHFQALGDSVLGARDWAGAVLDLTAFGLSALILNYALYGARLVPRWLSVWGLAGAVAVHGGGGDGDVWPRASVDDPGRVGRTAGAAGNGPRDMADRQRLQRTCSRGRSRRGSGCRQRSERRLPDQSARAFAGGKAAGREVALGVGAS